MYILKEKYLSVKYLLYFLVVLYLRKGEVPSRGKWKIEYLLRYLHVYVVTTIDRTESVKES